MLCAADFFFLFPISTFECSSFFTSICSKFKTQYSCKRQTAVFSTLYILPYTFISDSCLPWSLLLHSSSLNRSDDVNWWFFLLKNVSWLVGGSLVQYSDRYGWIEDSLSFCLVICRSPLNMMNWFIVFALNGATTSISFTYFFCFCFIH